MMLLPVPAPPLRPDLLEGDVDADGSWFWWCWGCGWGWGGRALLDVNVNG